MFLNILLWLRKFQEIFNLAAASSQDHPAFPGLASPHILQAAQVQQQAHQAAAQQQAQQLAQQQAQQAAQQQQQGKTFWVCNIMPKIIKIKS